MLCWLVYLRLQSQGSAGLCVFQLYRLVISAPCTEQAVELPEGAATYHCSTPRLMPLTSIDPSLAIGFYCGSASEYGVQAQGVTHKYACDCWCCTYCCRLQQRIQVSSTDMQPI
eukprot:GHRQ01016977.1.p1 GENE.GHRQ01016977.1~~GHRQ01016977.1.p1  ORF type:complete len:114 (-),score=4.31 GHRQ01016977.1:719-1060(-)